jgi:hypothetical protein
MTLDCVEEVLRTIQGKVTIFDMVSNVIEVLRLLRFVQEQFLACKICFCRRLLLEELVPQ